MTKMIRPLTLRERKKPAQLLFLGGFKNVSFQIGEILIDGGDSHQGLPGSRRGLLKKTEKIQFPLCVPTSVALFKDVGNIICTVSGMKNPADGLFDAILVVRSMERLSSFNTNLRTINQLKNTESEADERLGKGAVARAHNQVNLCGIVVGSSFQDGVNPSFHILLRQTSDPGNIIPLTYDAKNAGSQVGKIKVGSIIYVEGEYAFRRVNLPKLKDDGSISYNAEGQVELLLDENGDPIKRVQTYIRIQAPKEASMEFDVNFQLDSLPRWIEDMIKEIESKKQRVPEKKVVADISEL